LADVRLCVLTWNLKHGRAVPSAGRDLFEEFAGALARWEWDVALLQEVPPWWPPLLGARLGAEWRLVLTSRNVGLPLRRFVAVRWPDVIKSNGGGSNAVLVRPRDERWKRGSLSVASHRELRLTWLPERRWLIGVQLTGAGTVWVGNVHLTGGREGAAVREAATAACAMTQWAGPAPIVLGGDFNLRSVAPPGFEAVAGHGVDHILVRDLDLVAPAEVLERGHLSDHAPVAVSVETT
jgi:endonuclease/exonuclease/phosphatase family metal-dependent hydrolase